MKIFIMQTGEPLHCDGDNPRPMRAMNLANVAAAAGHDVTIFSSNFYHQQKVQRSFSSQHINVSDKITIKLINSPGYKNNLGIARLWDHLILAINLKKELKASKDLPDVAFVGFPPMEAAYVTAKWLNKNSIPFLIDVKDQWPSFIVSSLPVFMKPIGYILLSPYYYISKKAFSLSSGITTMANSFLIWAQGFSGRGALSADKVVPLTSKVETVDDENMTKAREWVNQIGIKGDKFRVMFLGSHYPSLNFDHIFHASKTLKDKGINCEFIICGTGQLTEELKKKSEGNNEIILTGWVDRPKINAIAEKCDLSIAPFRNVDNYTANLPNKIIDYLSLGLPILSPLVGELSSLIEKYDVGLTYDDQDLMTLSTGIANLMDSKDLGRMKANTRDTYSELFDFDRVYSDLVKHLETL